MATKANHHYIPQLYLRGFSAGAGRQAQIFVFDSNTGKSFTTLVRNVGSRRHFNRVEARGVEPNYIEDNISELEAIIAPHLQQVIEAQAFPSPKHFHSIMNLMAFLSVRNPRVRGTLINFHKDIVERLMGLSVSSKEIWDAQTEQIRENGVELSDNVKYDDMKRFHEDKNYEIIIDRTHLIGLELQMVEPVVEQLSRRNWCFACAPQDYQFITCDDPTVLRWNHTVRQPNPWSPGHGLKNTLVMFPLSPRLALIGSFDDLPEKLDYLPEQVVALNTEIARHSSNQIYARDSAFMVHIEERSFIRGDKLPDAYSDFASSKPGTVYE